MIGRGSLCLAGAFSLGTQKKVSSGGTSALLPPSASTQFQEWLPPTHAGSQALKVAAGSVSKRSVEKWLLGLVEQTSLFRQANDQGIQPV